MKIKVYRSEDDHDELLMDPDVDWYEDEGGYEVEIPDAIVKEWREVQQRFDEIHAYFEERVKPQYDVAYNVKAAERLEEWKKLQTTQVPEKIRDLTSFPQSVL